MAEKRAEDLLIGDTIIETITEVVNGKVRTRKVQYRVQSVKPAACSLFKTHVTVDNSRHWCYDSSQEVEIAGEAL